eukprot:TRINITY_DN120_c0_g1_i1.p1 TRINITY_DN120_c0_g1~~TRINITY_DN120_c0_g1_i1.p1  ORF type:complete len:254 (-),score=131.29 TRINITY_DN120_c0_g1_i1:170-931(-)
MATRDYTDQFRQIAVTSVDDQSKTFLRAFVLEFQGSFEQVLDLGAEFKKCIEPNSSRGELGEFDCHLFLEKRGETLTVKELRENLKQEVNLAKEHNVAFIEYLLWKYHKTCAQLFAPVQGVNPELLAALERAIDDYQRILADRQARADRMAELQRIADLGGVKGMSAKAQLEQMKAEDILEQNKREVTSAAAKRKAQKAVDNDNTEQLRREQALREEQERLEQERIRKEGEEKRKREQSRSNLAAKAALFGKK